MWETVAWMVGACIGAAWAVPGAEFRYPDSYGRWPLPPLLHVQPAYRHVMGSNMTLRQAAAGTGVFVGSALNWPCLTNATDPTYAIVAAAQYDLVTAENECKFAATQPGDATFDFTPCADVAGFAQKPAGMAGAFRGHNTVWGSNNPAWLTDPTVNYTQSQLEGIMTNHIATVISHFAPSGFVCWDVVNEAVSDSPRPNVTFKPADPWYPTIPNYVDLAFQAARAADPAAKLFYNDYGAEDMGAKSDAVYAMVSSMRQRGIPIDGVGLQMHISVDAYPDPRQVSANIARLGMLGLEVHITEMDVRCSPPCDAARLARQAQVYGAMLSACLNNTACRSFETWGFTDRYTWLWTFDNPTHINLMPLPLDTDYNPKPAWYELLATFQAFKARTASNDGVPPMADGVRQGG